MNAFGKNLKDECQGHVAIARSGGHFTGRLAILF